jgi:hypothetical protein
MTWPPPKRCSAQQRGNVVVLVAISMTLLIGFAALAIDLGQLYVARAELQRAADAAALAGASAYFSDAGLAQDTTELSYMIDLRAQAAALANPTHHAETILDLSDIVIGAYDFDYPDGDLDTSGSLRFNAVQVTTRRTTDSAGGPIALFFGGLIGVEQGNVVATATAVADDRFRGLWLNDPDDPPLIPFTISIDLYDDMVANGDDNYSYDGAVYETGDGIPEVRLFPWRHFPGDPADPWDDVYELDDAGEGNFGILEFTGTGAHATSDRILSGITAAELQAEIGTSELTFYDDTGNPTTYQMSGAPGIQAGTTDALEQRIGDVVGYFVHDQITGSGTNVEYRIVGVRVGRIMSLYLYGNPTKRHLSVQPVAHSGPNVMTDSNAPSTGGQLGRSILVK